MPDALTVATYARPGLPKGGGTDEAGDKRMWDWIELWLRKAGGPLLMGVSVAAGAVAHEQWWLRWRVLVLLAGLGSVAGCGVETWKLLRGRVPAKTVLDRLEAVGSGEGPRRGPDAPPAVEDALATPLRPGR